MLPLPTPENRPPIQFTQPNRRAYIQTKRFVSTNEAAEMRLGQHATRLNAPPWAMSDQKLQRVVAELMWRSVRIRGDAQFPVATYEVNKMAFVNTLEARLRVRKYRTPNTDGEQQHREMRNRIAHDKFGRSALLVAIIYLAYRNGMASPAIAAAVCGGDGTVNPPFVRQVLGRANMIARSLWPDECFELHHTANSKRYMAFIDVLRKRRVRKSPLPSGFELNKLFEAGEQPPEIAKRFRSFPCEVVFAINQHRELSGQPLINPKTFRVIICGPKPTTLRRAKYDHDEFRRLYEEGKTPQQIREATGASLQFIQWTLFNKFGINTGRNFASVIAWQEKQRARR